MLWIERMKVEAKTPDSLEYALRAGGREHRRLPPQAVNRFRLETLGVIEREDGGLAAVAGLSGWDRYVQLEELECLG